MALPTFQATDAAWLSTLEVAARQPRGRLLHVVIAVDQPVAPNQQLAELVDSVVVPKGHNVARVASTIFPSSCYTPPDVQYTPGMPAQQLEALDAAANDLYGRYSLMLPTLQGFRGNAHGTYFGRLVSWPGKAPGGYNQLEARVRQLRNFRNQRWSSFNAADMTVDVDDVDDSGLVTGLREYAVDDERTQGFPCLVHLDISVLNNTLSLTAVYRHWHLMRKAYGNLIGLTRLQHFLAQQSGYEVGELMVHATVANAEFELFSKRCVDDLLGRAIELVRHPSDRPSLPDGDGNGWAATLSANPTAVVR